MTTTIKAQVTSINLGLVSIEGLLLANGEFAVAVPQIAELLQFDKNQASRDIKALVGTGLQFKKVSIMLHPKSVNTVSIEDFKKIVSLLADRGNAKAREMIGLPDRSPSKMKTEIGAIYVLHDRQNHGFKVGFSTDVGKRIASHKTSHPFAQLVLTIQGKTLALEKQFHKNNKDSVFPWLTEWYDDRLLSLSNIASQFNSNHVVYTDGKPLEAGNRGIAASKSLNFGLYEINSVIFSNGSLGFRLADVAIGLGFSYAGFLDLSNEWLHSLTSFRATELVGESKTLCIDYLDFGKIMCNLLEVRHPIAVDYFEWSHRFPLLSFFQEAYDIEFDVMSAIQECQERGDSIAYGLASKVLSKLDENKRMRERVESLIDPRK